MPLNPLDLLKDVVTPQLTAPSDHQSDSKSALLGQFYPILLSLFGKFPDRLNQVLQTGQGGLAQLANLQPSALNGLLEAFSKHHNLPTEQVASLMDGSVAPAAAALQNAVNGGSISSYLSQYSSVVSSNIPFWAAGFLGALGLGHLAVHKPVVANTKPTVKPADNEGGFFKKILPWVALLLLLLLVLFFWRSCHPENGAAGANGNAASLALGAGKDGALDNCKATVGGDDLSKTIGDAVGKVFGADKKCDTAVDPATSTTLPGQDKLADVLAKVKATPGASVEWVGNKITVKGATPDDEKKLVADIKAVAPDLDVVAASASAAGVASEAAATASGAAAVASEAAATASGAAATAANAAGNAANAVAGAAGAAAGAVTGALSGAAGAVSDAAGNAEKAVGSSIDSAKSALAGLTDKSSAADVAKALNMEIINFSTGSNTIPAKNKEVLDQAAAVMKKLPNASFDVSGYTDNKGNADANKALSERRAKAVVAYLESKGVPAKELSAVGHGADNPVADNNTEEGRFKNRRIEFQAK